MKKLIDRTLLFVGGALASQALVVSVPEYKRFCECSPWLGISIATLAIFALICYCIVFESQDQRDVKTIIDDVENLLHLPSRCLTDTNVSRIDGAPDLASLLNCETGVTSRVMNKKQRIALPETSCVLQAAFIPIDKNGNTILWKRLPKNHVFKNGTASVLISFSPYARKFADVFVAEKAKVEDDRRAIFASLGVTMVELRDIYSREVPDVSLGCITPVGAYWLPRQKDERGHFKSPAYCFWVFAVRYDVDFNESVEVVNSIFARKLNNGKLVYLKKDNDKKMCVLPLKGLEAYLESDKLKLGKMDAFVAANYGDFLAKRR